MDTVPNDQISRPILESILARSRYGNNVAFLISHKFIGCLHLDYSRGRTVSSNPANRPAKQIESGAYPWGGSAYWWYVHVGTLNYENLLTGGVRFRPNPFHIFTTCIAVIRCGICLLQWIFQRGTTKPLEKQMFFVYSLGLGWIWRKSVQFCSFYLLDVYKRSWCPGPNVMNKCYV